MTKRIDTDTSARGRPGDCAASRANAPAPRWLRLGLAGVLGTLAGTMLFATRAEGATGERRRPER